MGDQLLCAAVAHHEVLLDKLNQTLSVRVTLVLEVETVWRLNNTDRFFVGIVLEN